MQFSCVLMGNGSLVTQCGALLLDRGHQIRAVVTSNTEVADWAKKRGLVRIDTDAVPSDGFTEIIFDWLFSIANEHALPAQVVLAAKKGTANFHDGPLPLHAGYNAPAWALLDGDTSYGVTWHALTERPDEGEIYVQSAFEIAADETSLTLNMKCFEAAMTTFGTLIDAIEAEKLAGKAQAGPHLSYHADHARPPAGGTLDFSRSTGELDRLARAMTFGERYENPLCVPKLRTEKSVYNVLALKPAEISETAPAGTVLSTDGHSATIATRDGAVSISKLSDQSGVDVAIADVIRPGDRLPSLSQEEAERLDSLLSEVARHETFFRNRLRGFCDLELYGVTARDAGANPVWQSLDLKLPSSLKGEQAIAGLVAGLARFTGLNRVDAFFSDDVLQERLPGYIADSVPFTVEISDEWTTATLASSVVAELDHLRSRVGYAADLANRVPNLGTLRSTIAIKLQSDIADVQPLAISAVTFALSSLNAKGRVLFDSSRFAPTDAQRMVKHLEIAFAALAQGANDLVSALPLMSKDELADLIRTRNFTQRDHDREALVHTLIERQAAATPHATAVVFGDDSVTYGELDARANRIAEYLVSLGVKPDSLVGLNIKRSSDLVVAALAILKAGGAYVPLDPSYPAARIAYMIKDSGLKFMFVEATADEETLSPDVSNISVQGALAAVPEAKLPLPQATPDSLAYVIYTSGSTGRPKGVMVEHRNVANFFIGMDERIACSPAEQPVWLAVTSLSFDISVLELFWTLARGFKVIVQPDERDRRKQDDRAVSAPQTANVDFGLFFWGDDDSAGPQKYDFLLESARFADRNGFAAVWTPERHFHAFGGPYPNPAVTGAAVAAVTQNLSVRAGSCVLPLHHPARVAEEWAVVDNISNGRVAVAFASGWMPEDFVLRPENAPPANKSAMFRDIDVVRRLWRGEKVSFAAPDGKSLELVTQPRPVQPELPVWVTTAGNPETFREAARNGANVLTHLLGQSIEDVASKVAAYREELRLQGRDPSQYKVTMMLHTLIGRDRDVVREQTREPMKRYLKSAAALIKEYAWAFPAFKRPPGAESSADIDFRTLSAEEMDAVVEFAFLRYFENSGLFGTVEDGIARIDQLVGIGIDEIACLIDFGVAPEIGMQGMQPLAELVAAVKSRKPTKMVAAQPALELESAGALIRRHGVTHLQCTPAMATMLLQSEDDANALSSVKHLFIGGEALQASLVKQLRRATNASIENMYGPTETTIWSSTGPALGDDGNAPLGTPIANTQLYVLDQKLRPVPRGLPGELFIGGEGVTRGYLNRPELTAERFIANPFSADTRMYRTGDIVRIGSDDALYFIGRADHQVKVRGYRIELGEIENCISLHPGVAQAVVIVREDVPGDARIVAYLRFEGEPVSDADLRSHVLRSLPEFMVPTHFVRLEQFPLTPNLKVDRKALPKPDREAADGEGGVFEAPASEVERQIADVFKRILGVERVGLNDNFFTLGGHSLLAVQAHREIKAKITPKLSITDLYRFPTISGLIGHLGNADGANKHLDKIAARALERRAALASRRAAATQLER